MAMRKLKEFLDIEIWEMEELSLNLIVENVELLDVLQESHVMLDDETKQLAIYAKYLYSKTMFLESF